MTTILHLCGSELHEYNCQNMPALIVMMKCDLGSAAAAYLLVFHVCFVMFCWTYWKAIFTPAATPSKKVGIVDMFVLYDFTWFTKRG